MTRRVSLVLLACLAVFTAACAREPEPAATPADAMFRRAMEFADRAWDEQAGLLWSVAPGETRQVHRVRESSWYACGLLMRRAPGDEARAQRIIDNVIGFQFDVPGQKWDGTYRRAPEEAPPGPGRDVLWKNFDPNWRLFIGTTFALVLEQHGERLSPALRERMLDSIRRAVEGEIVQGREEPYHTNVSLMHGFLLGWTGARLGRADWVTQGESWIERARAAFAVHGSFEEYNSPTYYGVDLYGLALCRRYGATEKIRAAASEMETELWRDVARFYHAGLRNLCGPFDRAYGIDMRAYVSLLGAWIGLVLPADAAPFPAPGAPIGHAHDFAAVPLYVALGAAVPADVLAALREFQGERQLQRTITRERTATAWISERLMLGGEVTSQTVGADPKRNQFVPATAHWRTPDGDVAWFRLQLSPPCDAQATKETLTFSAAAAGDFVFQVHAPGATEAQFAREKWALSGLEVALELPAEAHVTAVRGGENFVVTVRGAARFTLRCLATDR